MSAPDLIPPGTSSLGTALISTSFGLKCAEETTIVVPLLKPALVTLAVFMFVFSWNNFLWPLTVLKSDALYPVVLTINRLMSYTMSYENQNVVLAGALIVSLPTLVVFLVTQRVFVQGISAGSVKG